MDQKPEIVAIKVLKESASKEAEEDFFREVEIMSTFQHPNILSFIGVVLRGKFPYTRLLDNMMFIANSRRNILRYH